MARIQEIFRPSIIIRLFRPGYKLPEQSPEFLEYLKELWMIGAQEDIVFQDILKTISKNAKWFYPKLKFPINIVKCLLGKDGWLQYRESLWISEYKPLRIVILYGVHDSPITGHPGRETTFNILSRRFYWPKYS